MADHHSPTDVTGPWITDVPEDIEHPAIPLGLNEMTVPRAALVLSAVTLAALLVMTTWIGIAAYSFSKNLDSSFATGDESKLQIDGRWAWEVDLMFNTCEPFDTSWDWPQNLSDQDDVFLYPGQLSCQWETQGVDDGATIAIHHRGNDSLDLMLEIDDDRVEFASGGQQKLVSGIASGYAEFAEIKINEDVDDMVFNVTATHVSFVEAKVTLKVVVMKGSEQRQVHVEYGDSIQVHYIVWDADTDELLDEGDLPVVAGEDPVCDTPAPWLCYIDGFSWGMMGLDIDNDRGLLPVINTGTKHQVLLPPDIAYGHREGHELEETWMLFELRLTQYRAL
jgi:hypothetical protein